MPERNIAAGSELTVAAADDVVPAALRDAIGERLGQQRDEVAFAHLPLIGFPGEAPRPIVVVYLHPGVSIEQGLAVLAPALAEAAEAAERQAGGASGTDLDLLPIALDRPLDALAQAVVRTDSMLCVHDEDAWRHAREGPPPKPLWKRILGL
jgi:hypothetical protein